MRWIRVKITDTSRLVIPEVCPNCLSDGPLIPIPIVRAVGVPFGVSMTTTSSWPFCPRCADWLTRHTRWKRWFAIGPGIVLALLAAVIAVMTNDRGIHPSAYWLLLAAIVVAVFGCFAATMVQWCSPKPDSCLSNFPTVKPIRGGKGLLSRRSFGIFDFAHPAYVERLIEINDTGTLTVNERSLQRAKAAYDRCLSARPAEEVI